MKPQPIKSDRGLARRLGVSHSAVADWRKRFPGQTPTGYDLPAWLRFMEGQGLAEGARAGDLAALRKAKLKEISLRCESLSRELKRADREVVTVKEVDGVLGAIARRMKLALMDCLENELPGKVEGLTAAQVRPILREAGDRLLDQMADALADVPVKFGYGSEVRIQP